MKTIFRFIYILPLAAIACTSAIKDHQQVLKEEPMHDNTHAVSLWATPPVITTNLSFKEKNDLYGFWVGMFEPDPGEFADTGQYCINTGEWDIWNSANKISVSIDSMADDSSVSGHSIVAGNARPFKGTYTYDARSMAFLFIVSEPGDDKYDGTFRFSIGLDEDHISGTWKSYKKLDISERKYVLTKKLFRYDPGHALERAYVDWEKFRKRKTNPRHDDYYDKTYFATTEMVNKVNASKTLLKKEDVENFSKADLYILRNSIYARHGYSFRKRPLRAFFDAQTWYMPVHVDIRKDLTEIEKTNIKLLLRYEKNAEEYYDEFGRG
jgi:hypothetical protein